MILLFMALQQQVVDILALPTKGLGLVGLVAVGLGAAMVSLVHREIVVELLDMEIMGVQEQLVLEMAVVAEEVQEQLVVIVMVQMVEMVERDEVVI
jgi:hypothetical protein